MKFTKSHEWIRVQDGVGTVGITNYAQQELGAIVYIELPELNKSVREGDLAVVLESTKAAADGYTPVSGTIIEVNDALRLSPELVNNDAEGSGWLFKIRLTKPNELDALMDEATYYEQIG